MQEPIINPWLFYLASTCHKLEALALIMEGAILVAMLFFVTKYFVEEEKSIASCIRKLAIAFVAVGFLAVAIPSRDTIYAMAGASMLTPESVSLGKDALVQMAHDMAKAIADGAQGE